MGGRSTMYSVITCTRRLPVFNVAAWLPPTINLDPLAQNPTGRDLDLAA